MKGKLAHTPGPWTMETVKTQVGTCHKIGPFPSHGVYKETHACIYVDSIYPGMSLTAIGETLLANAKLIAAAPNLAEALRRIADYDVPDAQAMIAIARAALAKAGL